MRTVLKILAGPVIMALILFVWICSAVLYSSAFVFTLDVQKQIEFFCISEK